MCPAEGKLTRLDQSTASWAVLGEGVVSRVSTDQEGGGGLTSVAVEIGEELALRERRRVGWVSSQALETEEAGELGGYWGVRGVFVVDVGGFVVGEGGEGAAVEAPGCNGGGDVG